MPESAPSRREIAKILKQAQSGDLTAITNLQQRSPHFHWSSLKYQDSGDTLLHCAARLGHLSTVEYLLSYTPSGVDCKNNDDKTALHEAAQFSQPAVVRLLLEKGAQINALKRADWTPLMLACTKKCLETVRVLVENGGLINYCNKDGWTCMHLAAREGSGAIFGLLVEKGGDCGVRTNNGRSVLHVAALHGSLEVVEVLLKVGLDVNARDNCGNTPLHEGVLGRHVEVCRRLIENGADLHCTNNVDFSLLHLASSAGYSDVVEFIVKELGFDVNVKNCNGFTGLHCAARKGQRGTYELLIRLGCKEDTRDQFGRMALDYLN